MGRNAVATRRKRGDLGDLVWGAGAGFSGNSDQVGISLPGLTIPALVVVGTGRRVDGGRVACWATILLRDSFDLPSLIEFSTLSAMVLMMACGRLLADRWVDRYGQVRVARVQRPVRLA